MGRLAINLEGDNVRPGSGRPRQQKGTVYVPASDEKVDEIVVALLENSPERVKAALLEILKRWQAPPAGGEG